MVSKFEILSLYRIKLDEEEEKIFFFDNYDKMQKSKRRRLYKWRRSWPKGQKALSELKAHKSIKAQKITYGLSKNPPKEEYSTRKSRQAAKKLVK